MMPITIIDDQGDFWSGRDPQLWGRLSHTHSIDELRRFAIRNMGFVELDRSRALPRIRFRPRVLAPAAFASLMFWIFDSGQKRAVLSTLESVWHHEFFNNAAELTRRLTALSYVACDWHSRRFLCEAAKPDPFGRSLQLLPLHEYWKAGTLTAAEAAAFCRKFLGDRYTIAEAFPSGEVYVQQMGEGYRSYSSAYVKQSSGTTLIDDPDEDFGRWVVGAYQSVATSRIPCMDAVDALRLSPQQTTHRVCYRRAIFPLTSSDSSSILFSTSVLDDSINLRVKVA